MGGRGQGEDRGRVTTIHASRSKQGHPHLILLVVVVMVVERMGEPLLTSISAHSLLTPTQHSHLSLLTLINAFVSKVSSYN